eukprot:scaffold24764_cov60-Phaeocystis_antarctica.AAC.8
MSERREGGGSTRNISPMIMTRDVSKFSGWLNAVASCRVRRGAYDAGVAEGRREAHNATCK